MEQRSGIAGIADGAEAPKLSDEAIAYAKGRGLSLSTLTKFGVASGTAYFPRRLQRRSQALFVPYWFDGARVNYKAVAFPDKDFIGEKGGRLCFFNLDAVLAAMPETVYLTEGELDAMSLAEAGIPAEAILSVPNGARESTDGDDKPKGYGYVTDALDRGLGRVKRFVWCGDSDSAGLHLRADMARMLGPAKLWFVEWPEGNKDANDMLRHDGPAALADLVLNGALEWPIDGLYTLGEIPEPPPLTLWHPGFPEWESKVMLAPGTLSIVTGHPGHGKTQLWAQIWGQICRNHDVVACLASFETRAKPHHRRTLRSLISGKLERDMDHDECRRADAWIDAHYRWAVHPARTPTLQWLLDMAEVAVIRHGARIVQIDPWNRVEQHRPSDETETDYIGRCLTTLYRFAEDFGCHVQVLAHPAKMDSRRRESAVPLLDDISGSQHWANRADQGFTVHRPNLAKDGARSTEAVLYHRKSRFEELGHPCKLALNFDLAKGRYVSIDYAGVADG